MVGFPVEPLQKAEYPYAARLGAAIIQWNATEQSVRQLLMILSVGMNIKSIGPGTWLMIHELGTRDLGNALLSYANETLEGDEREAVKHVNSLYGTLVAYRNYYVHGITRIRPTVPEQVGEIVMHSAKGKLVEIIDDVTIEQLESFTAYVRELRNYVFAVQLCLIDTRHYPDVARPLPEKPLGPATLVKRRHVPQERPPQPPALPE